MKNKTILFIGIILIALVGGFFWLNNYIYTEKQADYVLGETVEVIGKVLNFDTSQVMVDGPVLVTLESSNGDMSTIAIPSAGLTLCPAYKNGKIPDGYLFQFGDSIQVRGKVGEEGVIIPCDSPDDYVRYISTEPIVVNDFEGEANPEMMKLSMKKWVWVSALYNDEREVKPKKPNVFTLTFEDSGRFSATTDCNSLFGQYSTSTGNQIVFSQMMQTKMYCEGSDEIEFVQFLTNTSGFHFTSKGEMILDLKFDSGSVIFR